VEHCYDEVCMFSSSKWRGYGHDEVTGIDLGLDRLGQLRKLETAIEDSSILDECMEKLRRGREVINHLEKLSACNCLSSVFKVEVC